MSFVGEAAKDFLRWLLKRGGRAAAEAVADRVQRHADGPASKPIDVGEHVRPIPVPQRRAEDEATPVDNPRRGHH